MHPIGVVAERTGLSPDVLRIWERRYAVVEPARDEAGRRLYSDADIERLRLLARASAAGRNISQLATLSGEALADLVHGDERARRATVRAAMSEPAGDVVDQALERAMALDAAGFEAVIRRASALHGLPVFLASVAAPLFRRIGDEWHAGRLSPVQEHLASAVTRSVVGGLLTAASHPAGAPVLVVGTPAGERHEIGALLVAAAAAAEGWRPVYLGADLPMEELVRAAELTGARAVAISVVYRPEPGSLGGEIVELRRRLPDGVLLLVGGAALRDVEQQIAGLDVEAPADFDELRSILRAVGSLAPGP